MSPSFKIRPAKIKHNWGTGALNLADTSCLNWKKIINVNIYREIVLLILQINTSNIVVVGSVSIVSLLFEVFTTTFIFELLPSLSSAIIGKYVHAIGAQFFIDELVFLCGDWGENLALKMALMFQSTSRLVLCFQWFVEDFHTNSRLPIIRTFKGNRKKFELSGVRVIEGKIIWKMI